MLLRCGRFCRLRDLLFQLVDAIACHSADINLVFRHGGRNRSQIRLVVRDDKRNLPLAEQLDELLLGRLQTARAVRDKNRNIRLFQHAERPADTLLTERALIINARRVDDNHRTDREQFHRLLHRIGGRALDIGNNGQCLSGHAVYHAGFARIAQAEKADVYALTGGLCALCTQDNSYQ